MLLFDIYDNQQIQYSEMSDKWYYVSIIPEGYQQNCYNLELQNKHQ